MRQGQGQGLDTRLAGVRKEYQEYRRRMDNYKLNENVKKVRRKEEGEKRERERRRRREREGSRSRREREG
eukprot:173286-Hanusia_phi.AAC.1